MPLKFKIAKKEDVPAEQASLYVEKEGVFVLDVEGAVAREKLEEFRTNNINLQNQLKAFEGVDVEKAKELLQKQKELEDANLIKSGDLGKIIEKQLSPIKAELDKDFGFRTTKGRCVALSGVWLIAQGWSVRNQATNF